jgi:hypothetical protein
MEPSRSYYCLVQYSPQPERMEFVNVGVVLFAPDIGFVGVRFAEGVGRVERLFGKQSKPYLDALKKGLEFRLRAQFSRGMTARELNEFAEKRANELRVSKPMPVATDQPENALSELFEALVGEEQPRAREPRVAKRLRDAFERAGVVHYLDPRPEVELPEYGVKVSVPFGYQNGCYNLVDAMRLPLNVQVGMREAGKRAMEGNLVWRHSANQPSRTRLVVVGDFSQQTNEFFHAVSEQMDQAQVKLHRLDDLRPLLRDIEENAKLHA